MILPQSSLYLSSNSLRVSIPNSEHISENETDKLLQHEDSVLLFMSPNDLTSFEQDYINKYHEMQDKSSERGC